ncbi:MAG: hypothetical protein ACI4SG_07090 [Oligosphaeraceae bacterium]
MESLLLEQLSSFETWKRIAALQTLAAATSFPTESEAMNMHVHSFYSYNGEGWSPSRIAFEMRKMGLHGAALCDFDVIQGVDEFMAAGDLLGLRTAASFESRVFFPEYADKEINSPGEPGVFYFMGSGFVNGERSGEFKAQLEQAHKRNRALIDRINSALGVCKLSYEKDVLPLTPDDNATERHIVQAYRDLAIQQFGEEGACRHWAEFFNDDPAKLAEKSPNAMNEYLRGKLMKKGGLGYEQPDETTFPPIDQVIQLIHRCRALPCSAWLDGSLPGEANPREQLECLMAKGLEMVNIIPDRNWNFKDPAKQEVRVRALYEYVDTANALGLPIIAGTECNKPGQRKVDDFADEHLRPVMKDFTRGADVLFGHTLLLRYANYAYCDQRAKEEFPERNQRNDFFASVGALPVPPAALRQAFLEETDPEKNLDRIRDAAKAGRW